jgi:hypothetical protein
MKIESGKYYKAYNGDKVHVISKSEFIDSYWIAEIRDDYYKVVLAALYPEDGIKGEYVDGYSDHDLESEWTETDEVEWVKNNEVENA